MHALHSLCRLGLPRMPIMWYVIVIGNKMRRKRTEQGSSVHDTTRCSVVMSWTVCSIATSVICAGHTSLFKSGFRLVTSIGGNYILCCTIQDTSRDINSLYYMYWVYAIVRKRIRYNKRYGDYVQCCTIEDTSRDINNLYYMCKLYMPICQSLKVDSLHQGVVSTVLYNTRYFRRHKQLVLFVPLFESGLAAWKGVVTTTQSISREKLFPN